MTLVWIYSPVCMVYWWYLVLQLLTCLTFLLASSLEAMSLLGILIVLQGHMVGEVATVVQFRFEFGFSGFALGGLPHFLLT